MREHSTLMKTLDLPGGSLMPFASAPGGRVRILYGRVWLTEEGNPADAFLASGDEVSLASRGLAVIEALGPARVQLYDHVARPSRLLQAVARLRRRGAAWIRKGLARGARSARGAA